MEHVHHVVASEMRGQRLKRKVKEICNEQRDQKQIGRDRSGQAVIFRGQFIESFQGETTVRGGAYLCNSPENESGCAVLKGAGLVIRKCLRRLSGSLSTQAQRDRDARAGTQPHTPPTALRSLCLILQLVQVREILA
jgi:hypothetical protein